ncbi:MAG: hypothetical protein ACRDHM_03530 [Actinomycetota bacterium]
MRRLVVALGMLAVLGGWSTPSWASCAPLRPAREALAHAKVAFVGTVVGLKDGDARRAVVRVEEVRKGSSLPERVEVVGTSGEGSGVVTSVDRTYVVGGRYLFVPTNGAAPFQDNACTATTLIDANAVPEGGAGVQTGTGTTADPNRSLHHSPSALPWLIGGAAVVGTASIALVVIRARRVDAT